MVCILDFGLTIWEVPFDNGIVPTGRFIRGSFVPFNIDGCIDGRETTSIWNRKLQAEPTA